jgi:propanol-preferring alcohol dehydrogenase
MGELVNVAASELARVPPELPAVAAAPICCAGWTALGAVRGAGLIAGQWLAVFGLGGVGHLAVQYARHLGIKVVAVDVSEAKLDQARALGAEHALPAADAGRAIAKTLGGVDAAIAFTPAAEALREALRALKRRATLHLVGMADRARIEMPLNDAILKGIAVRGSYLGTRADLEDAFAMAAAGIALPHVEVCAPSEVAGVLDRLRAGQVLGRAVVTFA